MTSSLIELFDLSRAEIEGVVSQTLAGADDGELFLEYREHESLLFDNGRLKAGDFSTDRGFGLRCVAGEAIGFAHAGDLSGAALKRAADSVVAVRSGHSGTVAQAPRGTNRQFYSAENPIPSPSFEEKVRLLTRIDEYLRSKDDAVRQVSVSLASQWQVVEILRADGQLVRDVRPMVRLNVSVVAGSGDRQETGSHGAGGRYAFDPLIATEGWQGIADEALRQARLNLEAVPAPAGTFDVVLGSGWPGVMLHEAVGHGLEGDYNRKKTSAFSGLLGSQVAARGVTVVDDGTISERRGSISVDDEGTPTNRTVLIEDGKLVNYMQDRQNARLMGMEPTGNGRRQSYAYAPMPRMTNTMMLNGPHTPDEIIASVTDGIYAVSFGGGQVDITSGKFVFGCTEAYRIRDGRVAEPVKGAMLIGNGPDAMHRVSMVGNDTSLDRGIGNCGKAGQWVPVGVGQPHLRMDQITVGGTET
ncbi:metalloprotease TldD [Aureimonas sp. ME7]|uniref:metalloprotease TldD n=1 Tax=Aureimonas sp. ME7 TaxID=2744252 RepID=UPI0015F6E4C5|nr:metalloprotease TldD [Aureimonas sp. ME7]